MTSDSGRSKYCTVCLLYAVEIYLFFSGTDLFVLLQTIKLLFSYLFSSHFKKSHHPFLRKAGSVKYIATFSCLSETFSARMQFEGIQKTNCLMLFEGYWPQLETFIL